jgi:hypothetical protein
MKIKNKHFWGKFKVISLILFLSLTTCLYSKAQDDIFEKNEALLLKKFSAFINAFNKNDGDYISKFFLYPIVDEDLNLFLKNVHPKLNFMNMSPEKQKKFMANNFNLILGNDFLIIKKTDLEKLKKDRYVEIEFDKYTTATLEIFSNKDIKCDYKPDDFFSFPQEWEAYPITTKLIFKIKFDYAGEGGGQNTWCFTLIGGQLFFDFFLYI